MSKKQTKQSRKTARRKEAQAEARRIYRLRERAMNFEGMSGARVARMSTEQIERVIATGKQRRVRMVSPFDGIALSMASARMFNVLPSEER